MAYYLTLEERKGKYTPLDITKTSCFYRISNLKNKGATLQEIDMFTMNFNNEKELRTYLFKNGLVEMKNAGKNISIRNLRNNVYYKVMYDILYQKDIDYIADPKKLIKRINDKLYAGDYRFIEKFAENYMNFHDCLSTAPEVREFAKNSARMQYCDRHFNSSDELGDNPLVRMTKLLIYDYYQEPNGRINYKNVIKYRNLHSILAFINHYDKLYAEEKVIENTDVKKRVKKKNDYIPGQTNLFDE